MNTSTKLGTTELLFRAAKQLGIQPSWVTPGGMFAVSVNGTEKYISCARSSLNPHVAISLAKDKYLTRLILERHGMLNIPFARAQTLAEAELFLSIHGKIIAKPRRGYGSQDIHIITDTSEFEGLAIKTYILEKYIAGTEMRYLILKGSVIAVHQSEYGVSVAEDRALQRISFSPADWNQDLINTSLAIAGILGLKFAAIDFMIDADGTAYILEANSTPGLKWFHAPSSGPVVDVARLFLEAEIGRERTEMPYAQPSRTNTGQLHRTPATDTSILFA